MSARATVKSAAKLAFDCGGGLRAVRWMKRGGLRILMYHRFSNGAALARQCDHIRRYYRPVPMAAVAEWLHAGLRLDPYSIAVTVDDGYRDFLEVAHPVFAAYGIPVTVFLVSDFLDGAGWLWFDRVAYAFTRARGGAAGITLGGETYPLDAAGASSLVVRATNLGEAERLELMRELPKLLDVEMPAAAPPEYRPLSWDEARALAAAGVEFGAHTRTHPILSAVPDAQQLRDEIAGSKARLEAELQRPAAHFCYPNGRRADIGPAAVEAVRAAGFRTAVTAEQGLNHARQDPFLLRRIGTDPGHEERYFQRTIAGFGI